MLNRLELGGKNPSPLYRQIADLAVTNPSEDLLKVKWLALPPQNVRNILKIFKAGSTQELLDAADTIIDSPISPSSFVVSVAPNVLGIENHSSQLSEIKELFSQLIPVSRGILTRVDESSNQQ